MRHTLFIAALLLSAVAASAQDWKPDPRFIHRSRQDTTQAPRYKYQCYGTTLKGLRCRHVVAVDSSYCRQHLFQATQH